VSSLGTSGTVPLLSLCGFMAWRGTAVFYMHFFGLKFLSDDEGKALSCDRCLVSSCMQCGFLLLPTETITSVKSELSEGPKYLALSVL